MGRFFVPLISPLAMKLTVVFLLALVMGVGMAVKASTPAEPELSKMTLTVQDIVDDNRAAKKLKKQLLKLEGIEAVNVNTAEGLVEIAYDKPTLGCCSAIHKQLESMDVNYTLVSNNEVPACSGDHDHDHHQEAASSPNCGEGTGQAGGCCNKRRNS